jgi:TM2 domain-containing membrane protein YozV
MNNFLIETQKKSPGVACLLNAIIPGTGYMYAGRVGLGIVVLVILFPLFLLLGFVTFGILYLIFWVAVMIDGYMCAERFNKALTQKAAKR